MIGWPTEFAAASAGLKDCLGQNSKSMMVAKDDVIYFQDDQADSLYFVLNGFVRLSYIMEDGSLILHSLVKKGCTFGELGLVDGGVRVDTASANGEAIVWRVGTKAARRYPELKHELDGLLGKIVAKRYRSFIETTRNLYLSTLQERLARAVLKLATEIGTEVFFEGRTVSMIGPVVTQQDLGAMARGNRGNVNRVLKAWEAKNWIVQKDRSILISSPEKLEQLSVGILND